MRKTVLLSLVVCVACCFAAERTPEEAAQIAAQFTNVQPQLRKAHATPRTSESMRLVATRTKNNSTAPAYYVFNQENNGGFVIVSGDDLAEDVLVYSESGQFDENNINPNFQFWLNRMQKELSAINESNAAPKRATQVTAIKPLLVNKNGVEITWEQMEPYYNQCPMDLWKTSERCLTGCVATATAQIMYKWRYPAKGIGSHSYTWECCKDEYCTRTKTEELSKDFSTVTFDWDNMLPAYSGKSATTAQKEAVATLMSCCGIACDMQYGGETIGGSGAWTDDMGYALTQYFDYKIGKFITTYSKSDYKNAKGTEIPDIPCEWSLSTSKFTSYFNTELEAGRPILMGGEDDNAGGHEFVCDGRDTQGRFHINWGWEGDSNCYTTLSALQPSGTNYQFSDAIDAIIGICPNSTTGYEAVESNATSSAKKYIQQGELIIERNGVQYTITGAVRH